MEPPDEVFKVFDWDLCSAITASIVVLPNLSWVLKPKRLWAPLIRDPLNGILTLPSSTFWMMSSSFGV